MSERFWANAISRLEGSQQDGIHLLWVPPYAAGYSVRGFDIQRRTARPKPEIDCLALTGAEFDILHRRLYGQTPYERLLAKTRAEVSRG